MPGFWLDIMQPDMPPVHRLSMNYDIKDPKTGKIYHFAEGTDISQIVIFAGKGTSSKLSPKVVAGLSKQFGVGKRGWQHAKGLDA